MTSPMPELPEVETVRRGLEPYMVGARLIDVEMRRPDLRFAFPDKFSQRLKGWRVAALDRRAKYLLARMTSGETLIMHLGMSGRFRLDRQDTEALPGTFHHEQVIRSNHDHVVFRLDGPTGGATLTYNDARRFGFMDLVNDDELESSPHFSGMGPEPLSPELTPETLSVRLRGRASPIKLALLDQRIIAGLGNIYVCEALFRAGISPRRKASTIAGGRAEKLVTAIRDVLTEAIAAGGSTLRDHAKPDGELGYFQHTFRVYDREGHPCPKCETPVRRITQSGRSTFYCPSCQR